MQKFKLCVKKYSMKSTRNPNSLEVTLTQDTFGVYSVDKNAKSVILEHKQEEEKVVENDEN